ncbi:MAG: WG repeat-containing protein [Tannerella sp.]|nr:WG repeat-containing protein [Tannerella sp.]
MIKRIFSSAMLAIMLISGIVYGVKLYKHKYGEVDRNMIAKHLTSVMYNNGEYAIIDFMGNVVGDRFDMILGFDSGYDCLSFVICKGNKRGFLSTESGKQIFAPQFDRAWIDNPKLGLAAVVIGNKLGFVNVKTGKMAIEPQFDFENQHLYYNYIFRDNGYCIVPGKDSKFGVIDTTGKLLLPCQYDDVTFDDFGFVELQFSGKLGLCDSLLHIVLPPVYDRLEVFDLGIMVGELDYANGHKQYLLAYDGKEVISKLWLDEMDYEEIATPLYEPVAEGNKYDNDGYQKQGKKSAYTKFYLYDRYGVFDEKFNVIIPAKYDDIDYIGNGYFSCELGSLGAILNSKGQFVHGK